MYNLLWISETQMRLKISRRPRWTKQALRNSVKRKWSCFLWQIYSRYGWSIWILCGLIKILVHKAQYLMRLWIFVIFVFKRGAILGDRVWQQYSLADIPSFIPAQSLWQFLGHHWFWFWVKITRNSVYEVRRPLQEVVGTKRGILWGEISLVLQCHKSSWY